MSHRGKSMPKGNAACPSSALGVSLNTTDATGADSIPCSSQPDQQPIFPARRAAVSRPTFSPHVDGASAPAVASKWLFCKKM